MRGVDEAREAQALLDAAVRELGAVADERDVVRVPGRLSCHGEAWRDRPPQERRDSKDDALADPGAPEEVTRAQGGGGRQLRGSPGLVENAARDDDHPKMHDGELDALDDAIRRPGSVENQSHGADRQADRSAEQGQGAGGARPERAGERERREDERDAHDDPAPDVEARVPRERSGVQACAACRVGDVAVQPG